MDLESGSIRIAAALYKCINAVLDHCIQFCKDIGGVERLLGWAPSARLCPTMQLSAAGVVAQRGVESCMDGRGSIADRQSPSGPSDSKTPSTLPSAPFSRVRNTT